MIKFLLTIITIAGITMVSYAQDLGFKKGTSFVEGGLRFSVWNRSNDNDVKSTDFSISPSIGHFFTDKFALGLYAGYGYTKDVQKSLDREYNSKRNHYGIGAYGRYYFFDLGNRLKTYAELGAGFSDYSTKHNDEYYSNDVDSKTYRGHLAVGANYFIKNNLALGYKLANLLSYNYMQSEYENGNKINESAFAFSLDQFNSGTFTLTYLF